MEPTSKTLEEIDEAREKEDMKKLEAVFFVSGRFLNMGELVSLTDLNPIILQELIEKLQEKYDKNDSAIEIIEKNKIGHTYELSLSDDFYDYFNFQDGSDIISSEEKSLKINNPEK